MSRLFSKKVFRQIMSSFLAFIMALSLCMQGIFAYAIDLQIINISLNETRTIITLQMSGSVSVANGVSLANKILLSHGGASPSALPSGSDAVVSGNSIQISLPNSLTYAENYFVITAGTLDGQSADITSSNIDASDPKLASDAVSIDDTKKIVTIRFASAFSGYPSDEALKNGYITLARNGSNFSEVISSGDITIEGSYARLTIRLSSALTGSSARFKIAAGKVKNSLNGNLNLDDIITPAISADFDKTPPQVNSSSISLSADGTTVTMNFDEAIYNVYATGVSSSLALDLLKSHIWISRNGSGYNVLSGQDTVSISGNTLTVRYASALSGSNNAMKIDGGSLRDTTGNVQNTAITTGSLSTNNNNGNGAPQYNDTTGSTISSDMRTITFTFDRNITKSTGLVTSQLRTRIYVNRNGRGYATLDYNDTVTISGNKLIIQLQDNLVGSNNRVKVIGYTVASTSGDALTRDIESVVFNATGAYGGGPTYSSVSYNAAKRQVSIQFNTAIYAVSNYNLKNGVYISRNKGSYVPLSSYDLVEIYNSNTLLITLENALTGDDNRLRVMSGTLKDASGNQQYFDQTTGYISATDTSFSTDFKVNFSMSVDRKNANITFDRNIFSNYPYDTSLTSLKQAISISRNSGMGYTALGPADSISLSGRTLSIGFQKSLSETDVIRIGKNALKDSTGTVLAAETKVGSAISAEKKVFDPDSGVQLSSDQYTVTITFNQRIYNNMASVASLKNMIRIAYDGNEFEMLNEASSIYFQTYGEIRITFDRALSNPKARIKILAGALQDENGNTINEDIITNPLGQTNTDVEVTLGGSRVYFSDINTTKDGNGNKLYTVTVKSTTATSEIGVRPNNVPFSVVMPDIAYGGKVVLNGYTLQQLKDKNSTITVSCGGATHILKSSDFDINNALKSLNLDTSLVQNMTVELGVSKVGNPYLSDLSKKAAAKNFKIINEPTEFTILYKTATNTYAVTKYSTPNAKRFSIKPSEANNRHVTIVRVETSGKVNPVPTKTIQKDGDFYLEAMTRNNGVYAVISGTRSFSDTPKWAETAVNALASRMVLQGVDAAPFRAVDAVSRAEVAEMVTRALGVLTDKSGASNFFDVTLTDWYFPSISIATEYGLIRGYGDNTFRPEKKITRQEVMSIMARVIRFIKGSSTETQPTMSMTEANQILSRFADSNTVSEWAKIDMAECIKAGVVKGDDLGNLKPLDNITRVQMAQLIYNLLTQYDLINKD